MAMRSIQRFTTANEYTPLIRDQMVPTRQMVARSPNDSEVTIRASDSRWYSSTQSTPTPRVRIIPPTPLEGSAFLPDEPQYYYEDDDVPSARKSWFSTVLGWAGIACFLPVKCCVYASRASKHGNVASRVA